MSKPADFSKINLSDIHRYRLYLFEAVKENFAGIKKPKKGNVDTDEVVDPDDDMTESGSSVGFGNSVEEGDGQSVSDDTRQEMEDQLGKLSKTGWSIIDIPEGEMSTGLDDQDPMHSQSLSPSDINVNLIDLTGDVEVIPNPVLNVPYMANLNFQR